jgi:hypothetical protein
MNFLLPNDDLCVVGVIIVSLYATKVWVLVSLYATKVWVPRQICDEQTLTAGAYRY